MTRLEFNLGQKNENAESKEAATETGQPPEAPPPPVDFVIAEIDLIGTVTGEKIDQGSKMSYETTPPSKTVDWIFVRRVAVAQIVLASLSMICLLVTVIMCGVTWFNFATFFWSTFILLAGYAGVKSSSTKNYYYVLTYLIMAAFQSLTNWFALVYSTYAAYYFGGRGMRFGYRDVALFLELTEGLTMMGTVITGILGAKAACAGLGRLLTYQDQLIQQRLAWRQ